MTSAIGCEEVVRQLFEFMDRELDADSQREIERHLEACRGCFSRAEFERCLRAHVAEAAVVEAPRRLRERIRLLTAQY